MRRAFNLPKRNEKVADQVQRLIEITAIKVEILILKLISLNPSYPEKKSPLL